jgi:hypothetical protein
VKFKAILVLVAICAILGVVFVVVNKPETETTTEPRSYVWDFQQDDLQRIEISLPKSEIPVNSIAWNVHEDKYFYFDEPNGCQVDNQRWGGGIPLILSGPGAQRKLGEAVNDTQLASYGFNKPNMKITLTLATQDVFNVVVGDAIPSGQAYYVKLAEYPDVYTVDLSWYQVLERLITEPPYPPANISAEQITISPSEPSTYQTVTISVLMANTGCLSGTYDVVLKINNVVEGNTQTIKLDGRNKETVVFTTKKEKAGIYSVTAGGKSAKLVVK